jgi:hypothetical protein
MGMTNLVLNADAVVLSCSFVVLMISYYFILDRASDVIIHFAHKATIAEPKLVPLWVKMYPQPFAFEQVVVYEWCRVRT